MCRTPGTAPFRGGGRDAAVNPIFFRSPEEFRVWLEGNHAGESALWVGFHRKATGRASMTWPESVDEALCYGWIDGVRRKIDDERYAIRFTPRRPGSNWSAVNLRRMEELLKDGRVRPAGRAAYEARDPSRTDAYSFEQRDRATLPEEFEREFRAHADAWAYFERQPPGYRRTATWWVVSAKREDTRRRRFSTLLEDSAAGRRIGLVRRDG